MPNGGGLEGVRNIEALWDALEQALTREAQALHAGGAPDSEERRVSEQRVALKRQICEESAADLRSARRRWEDRGARLSRRLAYGPPDGPYGHEAEMWWGPNVMREPYDAAEGAWAGGPIVGAIAGDIVGSVYEHNNVKTKRFEPLFALHAFFTDDTVHTVAVMDALMNGRDIGRTLHEYTRTFRRRGYGGRLLAWAKSREPKPYCSFGNGSSMRVSACAWWARSEAECLALAKASADPTHNHPEGVKGAQATALAVWLARERGPTPEARAHIRERIQKDYGYDLRRSVDQIRPGYGFDVTCMGSVPEALICALEAEGYEDAVRNAISIGGDSDTIAAIAGSVAEALWGVPDGIRAEALDRLEGRLAHVARAFSREAWARQDESRG